MANRNTSSQTRHAARSRRQTKRRLREEVLQHELELRVHSPVEGPAHLPRVQTPRRAPLWKFVRRAVAALCLLGLVELVVALLTAKPFQVADISIAGCELVPEHKVQEWSRPLLGQNWIRANTREIEEQIETLPVVKTARVHRVLDWPPRLHVEVIERAAFARVGAGEEWWIVDESGVAFRRAEKIDNYLYAVTGPQFRPRLGSTLPDKQWHAAVEITQALQEKNNKAQSSWSLRRIYFDKEGSASLRLSGGFHNETLVRLGGAHWPKKIERARQALAYFERTGRRAKVLNLVSYDMPQWTPRAAPPASTSASTPARDANADTSYLSESEDRHET